MNTLINKAMKIQKEKGIIGILNKLPKFIDFKIFDYKRKLIFKTFNIIKYEPTIDIQGSKMLLDNSDYGISMDLYFDKIREKDSTEYLQTLMIPGQTILDIGANVGYYALQEAKAVGQNGIIYAIEPNISSMNQLKKNVNINKYHNITFCDNAIGDKNDIVDFYVAKESNLSSLFNIDYGKITKINQVQMITTDEFLKDKKHPDIIRMDVEGAEFEILKGMNNTLKQNKDMIIFMELHTGIMSEDKVKFILQTLKDNGFTVKRLIKEYSIRHYKKELVNQLTIDEMLNNSTFLNGLYGPTREAHIFFEKKKM